MEKNFFILVFDFFMTKGWLDEALKLAQKMIDKNQKTKCIKKVIEGFIELQFYQDALNATALLPPEEEKKYQYLKS